MSAALCGTLFLNMQVKLKFFFEKKYKNEFYFTKLKKTLTFGRKEGIIFIQI